jgi:hypothetical protein
MAEIIPFPATPRVGYIERLAWQMAAYKLVAAAEKERASTLCAVDVQLIAPLES